MLTKMLYNNDLSESFEVLTFHDIRSLRLGELILVLLQNVSVEILWLISFKDKKHKKRSFYLHTSASH